MNKKIISLLVMTFLGSSLILHSAQQVIQSGQTITISGNGLSEMAFYSADKQWSVIPIADAAYEVVVNQKESAQSLAAQGQPVGFSIDWSNKQLMSYYYSFGQYIQVAFNPNAPTYLNGNGPWTLYVDGVSTNYTLNTNVSNFFIKMQPVQFQVQTIGQGFNLSLGTQVISGLSVLGNITSAYFVNNLGNKYFFPITGIQEINVGLQQGVYITTTDPYSFMIQGLQVEPFSTVITSTPLKLYVNNTLVAIIEGFYHQYNPDGSTDDVICILKS